MSRTRMASYALATIAGLLLALGSAPPANAHQTGPPTGCGFDHGCSYKHAHYGTKIWSPSGLGSVCHSDFDQISGLNDELSSVYNHETGKIYWLYQHRNFGGDAAFFTNNAFVAHLSSLDFNDEASSCSWS